METVLITGGTGMIGKAITKALLTKGYKVIILTRKAKPSAGNVDYKAWDPEAGTIDDNAVSSAQHIIHLAGANVADGRWTASRKKEIVDSRVKSGELLVQQLMKVTNTVRTVISASAIGWYGADQQVSNPTPFTENDGADDSFLGRTCQQWEAAVAPVAGLKKRLVTYRIGIVLANEGGAYAEFKKPLAFGVAAALGSGKQMVSWIHIDDVVRLFVTALENAAIRGTYNAVAPNPVTNKALITEMAKQRNKFSVPLPVPAVALKLGLGEMSVEVLKSATVSCKKIEATGFQFQFPAIAEAVKNLMAVEK